MILHPSRLLYSHFILVVCLHPIGDCRKADIKDGRPVIKDETYYGRKLGMQSLFAKQLERTKQYRRPGSHLHSVITWHDHAELLSEFKNIVMLHH